MTVEDRHLNPRLGSIPAATNALAAATSKPASQLLRFRSIMLASLAIVLTWGVITRSLTAYLAHTNPEMALRVRSNIPTALLFLADKKLNPDPGAKVVGSADASQPDTNWIPDVQNQDALPSPPGQRTISGRANAGDETNAQIRTWAKRALLYDPLNARALRILGQVAHSNGDEEAADALMKAAAQRSLHESQAIYWMMQKSLQDEDFRAALRYADILLRTRQNALAHLMPMLGKIAESAEGGDALKQVLAGNPPWRGGFFSQLPSSVSDARTPLEILLSLRNSSTPPTAADLKSYVNFLVRHGFYELAYYSWLQFLPAEQLTKAARLFNGSFEFAPSGVPPFDWTFTGGAGVTINVVARPYKDGQHALLVRFGPGRVEFRGVTQLVLLPPGSYRLQGEYQIDLVTQRGLRWLITCAGRQNPIGASETMSGSDPTWKAIDTTFIVPTTGCPAQYISLALDARSASERFASGYVWYDDLSITLDKNVE